MITDEQAERALKYLADTDEAYAQARGHAEAMKYKRTVVYSQAFLKSEAKTNPQREADALTSKEYKLFLAELKDAITEKTTYEAKRKRAELTIEVWRSENANRRQGSFS